MVNYSLVNLVQYQDIASNGNTLRGHQTEFRLLHVKRLISDYAQVVIVARTTEWPLALADQGEILQFNFYSVM